jgi:hypothetical protein
MLNMIPLHIMHMNMVQQVCAHYAAIFTVSLVKLLCIPLFRFDLVTWSVEQFNHQLTGLHNSALIKEKEGR